MLCAALGRSRSAIVPRVLPQVFVHVSISQEHLWVFAFVTSRVRLYLNIGVTIIITQCL